MPPKTKPASPKAPPEARVATAPRWLRAALVAIAACLLMGWFSREFGDPDAWWHLKTGQYIWQNRALPVPDPFSYTAYMGKPAYGGEEMTRRFNLTHEWLAQVIFYLAYAAAGFPGIILLRAVLLTLFCALVGLLAWHRSQSFYRSLGAALACALIADRFVSDRPFLITFVLLAATMLILERGRRLWLLPPLFVFWSNCHGGYFLGWFVLAAYCVDTFLKKGDRHIYYVTAFCILVSGLNLNFYAAIPVFFAYRQSPMQSALLEWHHTAVWPLEPFGVLLFATIAVVIAAYRRLRPVDWILFLAFAASAIFAVRNVILVGLIGPVLIAAYLPWKRVLPAAGEWLVAALLLAAALLGIVNGTSFQLRAAEWKYPRGAVDFLAAHHITAPLFNSYEDGGYLMWRLWPEQKVFIDGRALNESVAEDYKRIAWNADTTGGKTADQLLDQYGIEVILMPGFEFTGGSAFLLPASLADPSQAKWRLVYQDAQGMVFMRQPPAGVQPLNSLDALASMETQCTEYIKHDPVHPGCARSLGDLFTRIGEIPKARQWLNFYLEHRTGPDPEAEGMYQRLLGR